MCDEVHFLHADAKVLWNLILSILIGLGRHAQSTQTGLHYLNDISRKKLGMMFIFYIQVNIKVFHDLIVTFVIGVTRHAKSTENNKFAIF